MNQTYIFALKKRKSHPEQEIKNASLTSLEYQTTKKLKRKQSKSQVQLEVYSENEENLDDLQSQNECKFNTMTSMNYQQVPSFLSIYTSESNLSIEEEFEIWDDKSDLRVLKIILEDQKPSIEQFLLLYDQNIWVCMIIMSRGFPGQQQCIKNEEVIKTAVTYASSNKKLFKKYFPSKKIVFEDDIDIYGIFTYIDYSLPYKIEDDHHYQCFNHFFKFKKTKTFIEF